MNTTLLNLFAPPPDCFGDFGFFCGFTASPTVLKQIRRNFTGDMARPVLGAFIHPTVNAISDIHGLAWLGMQPKSRGYNLQHAKVALLGFRKRRENGYVIRLAVCTGNWTEDPLTNSIDLFWSIDLDTTAPQGQDIVDIRRSWEMFNWLRQRSDCSLIDREYDGLLPYARLLAEIETLPHSDNTPRFIDSRTQALFPQVVERIGMSKKANRLILGSGYFEAGEEDDPESLPERLRKELVKSNLLTNSAQLDLFLNPASCQGLVTKADSLEDAGWRLRKPHSIHHESDAKLHAKFVLLAREDKTVAGRIYLGSGNLSRNGFERAASTGGNLEAGVVVDLPTGLDWPILKNRKYKIARLLPIQFRETVALATLQAGEGFVPPEEPETLPPVSWLYWQNGQLSAPEEKTVVVFGPDGTPVSTPCEWPDSPPVIVTLVDGNWRVPVISDDVLVAPRPADLTVEDVLASLASFPEPADADHPDDDPEERDGPAEVIERSVAPSASYAIRRMMELLVRLGTAQEKLDPRDWPRWCRELRQNLTAIAEQEAAMIGFFANAEANPLPVLFDPRMCPKGVDRELLETSLARVAEVWDLTRFPSLWANGEE